MAKDSIFSVPSDSTFVDKQAKIGAGIGCLDQITSLLTCTAEERSTAGHEFPQTKRLDQVIVRPYLKTKHAIGFAVPGTDHQNWCVVVEAPQLSTEIKPPQTWEHQIQDKQVNRLARLLHKQTQRVGSISTGVDIKTLKTKRLSDGFENAFVIFNNQEPACRNCTDRALGHKREGQVIPVWPTISSQSRCDERLDQKTRRSCRNQLP